MRLIELALLLPPPLLALAWWLGAPMVSRRMLTLAALLLAGLVWALLHLETTQSFTGRYLPAHLKGDEILPPRTTPP